MPQRADAAARRCKIVPPVDSPAPPPDDPVPPAPGRAPPPDPVPSRFLPVDPLPPCPVIGVVGGVGSGKSTLARAAGERWCLPVLDGDAAGHAALRDAAVRRALRDRFGGAIFRPAPDPPGGEEIDRSALAARVFGDAPETRAAKDALQAVVHPVIRADLLSRIAAAKAADAPAVLLDAAVLLETGWRDDCDAVVFVDAPPAERLRRVAARGWDAAELDRREASQWPLDRKRAAADAVVGNGDGLAAAVDRFGELLTGWNVPAVGDSVIHTHSAAPAAPPQPDRV